jgi:hypothetical protein
MVAEFSDGRSKVPFAERYHSRQALRSDRPDKSLGERVQIRTLRRQTHKLHTSILQGVSESGSVQRVSIENEIVRLAEESIVRVGEVPRHLSHPPFVCLCMAKS